MWKVVNYEVCGRSHHSTNTPCQDKTNYNKYNDVYCIALADGAGSAKLSHFGAESVTKFIVSYLTKNFDTIINNKNGNLVKQEILRNINEVLKNTSEYYKCEIKELSSTLLFVAIKQDKFIIGHLGDGIIGYLKNNEILVASKPTNGEFVNSTFFTTSSKALQNMKLLKGNLNDIDGFILMSDGSADSFYNKKTESLSNAAKKIVKWNSILEYNKIKSLLKDSFDKFVVQNTNDDCSISVISKYSIKNRFAILEQNEKKEILEIKTRNERKLNRTIKRYEDIIYLWNEDRNLRQISNFIHLKPKYTKRKIKFLLKKGIISDKI